MRRRIFYITVAILLFLLVLIFLIFSNLKPTEKKSGGSTDISPAPIIIPSVRKIDTDGVKTNDFLKNPIKKNSDGDVLFIEKPQYQISYLIQFSQFNISISTSSPQVRNQAEEEFMKKLGINKIDACRLNVVVNSPYVPNPYLSVPPKYLSFCRPD